MIRKIKLFFGIYNLREEGRLFCIREFGEEYGDEFIQKYDDLNQGIPIGGIYETAVFIDLVEHIKTELDKQSWKRLFYKKNWKHLFYDF